MEGFQEFLQFISTNGKWEYTNEQGNTVQIIPAIVTNAPIENVLYLLDLFNYSKFELSYESSEKSKVIRRKCPPFVDIFVVDERGCKGKPFPDPYANAMIQNNLLPQNCIAFEDSPTGIRSAVSANVKTVVGMLSTHTEENLYKAGVKTVITSWEDALKYGKTPEEWIKTVLSL